jgi:hypothetical protein
VSHEAEEDGRSYEEVSKINMKAEEGRGKKKRIKEGEVIKIRRGGGGRR